MFSRLFLLCIFIHYVSSLFFFIIFQNVPFHMILKIIKIGITLSTGYYSYMLIKPIAFTIGITNYAFPINQHNFHFTIVYMKCQAEYNFSDCHGNVNRNNHFLKLLSYLQFTFWLGLGSYSH